MIWLLHACKLACSLSLSLWLPLAPVHAAAKVRERARKSEGAEQERGNRRSSLSLSCFGL